jgi:hypothetical protein
VGVVIVELLVADLDLCCRYFVERGTWDETLGFFMNSDGDPSQFSVSGMMEEYVCAKSRPWYVVYTRGCVVSFSEDGSTCQADQLLGRFVLVSKWRMCTLLPLF